MVNLQGDEENDNWGLSSGQDPRLALFPIYFQADMLNHPSGHKKNDQQEQDQRGRRHTHSTKHTRDIYTYVEDNSSVHTSKISCSDSDDMNSFRTSLRKSRYLRPAQQLLDEVVCVSNVAEHEFYTLLKNKKPLRETIKNGSASLQRGQLTDSEERDVLSIKQFSTKEKLDVQIRITKLTALLEELEEQYEKYCHQMDGVISSFEMVTCTGSAKSYIALTIQAMSRHFSNLREAMIIQLHALRTSVSLDSRRNYRCISLHSLSDQNQAQTICSFQNLGMVPSRQVWRPLRGLPENSVAILRAWLFEHFLHPYPNDNEKLILSSQTGLTRNQISNWFINARVRLWKPMIEEMYKEEFAEDRDD